MLAYFVDNFDPFIFRLWDNVGPRWYGFAYVLAFVSAYFVVRWLSKHGYCDLPPERVSDFITWTALFGVLIGGRIGYAVFYRPEMLRDPLSILRVWEGGMASHGGMIGILALSFYYARRHKLPWTNLGDALVVAAPIGLLEAPAGMTFGSDGRSRLISSGGDQAGLRCLLETWDTPVHCFPARPTPTG